MTHNVTVQLSDGAYAALDNEAQRAKTSPAHVAADVLEREYGIARDSRGNGHTMTEAERHTASRRFERHFGALDLGRPAGADNETIDADLAREYADSHEAP